MNREIKFRAWDSEKSKMLFIGEFPLYHEEDNGLHSGKENKSGDWYSLPLMQFIGLKDKNGVDIYERDIVKTPSGIGKVCFDEQYLQYFILYQYDGSEALDIGFTPIIQVIGNIYENPELLKLNN